jgi:hypothetical protein
MFDIMERLPSKVQGLLYMAAGLVMVLYALGLVQKGISFAVVVLGLFLLSFGCAKTGLDDKISHVIARLRKRH